MRIRRFLSAIIILLCGLVLWGCTNNNRIDIVSLQPYYIQELEPFAFSRTVIGEDGDLVDMYPMRGNEYSFLEFAPDFKSMWIVFPSCTLCLPNGERCITFVITSGSPSNGNIRGTASRIMPDGPDIGKLIRYNFWSDRNRIYIQTLTTYRVGTEHAGEHAIVTVQRRTVVAEFARTQPAHIGGGA